jgi:Cu(I)/Ag(I) efflux system membrane fusion protein
VNVQKLRDAGKRLLWPLVAIATFGIGLAFGPRRAAPPSAAVPADHVADADTVWTCSMHPQIRMNHPGKCPICGMDLIPVQKSSGGESSPMRVTLSERAKAMAAVRTAPVRRSDTSMEIRLQGRLEQAETLVRTITPWTAGRIDRLYVSNVGARIGPGTIIALLYSPEIYAAQQDLIQARIQLEQLKGALPVARDAARTALDAARKRLELLGLSSKDVTEMEQESTPRKHVKIRSRYGGTVLEQLVNEGSYVTAGTPLYKTADLSSLWVQLDAYETDLARIKKKSAVTLTVSSYPGQTFDGVVDFIDPVVDPKNRTAQVRVEVQNEDGKLSPGMFVEAVIQAPASDGEAKQLVIPATAPLFTGKRSVVYVAVPAAERPTYAVREVQLGPRAADVYPVVSGLTEGERVVVNGAFALDADLQIHGGHSMMTLEDDDARAARRPIPVPPDFLAGLAPVVTEYTSLHEHLRSDDLDGARESAARVAKAAKAFDPRSPEEARKIWTRTADAIFSAAMQISRAGDLDAARRAFEQVTEGVLTIMERFGNPTEAPLTLAFCPMVFDNQGGYWVQRSDEIENPYFGSSMYRCGEIKATLDHGQHLSGQPAPMTSAPNDADGEHQH